MSARTRYRVRAYFLRNFKYLEQNEPTLRLKPDNARLYEAL